MAGSAEIANPDRGFYHYTETHYRPDNSGYTPLDPAQLAGWRAQDKVTVVYRIFFLEKFTTQDGLDPDYLQLVANDFATARAAGVKLLVRFAYSDTSNVDATPARVVGHIQQLSPVLNSNADIIEVLQAGFIGQWGEWYYSSNFTHDSTRPWDLDATDWANRDLVLAALLADTAPSIALQVRYPGIKQQFFATAGDTDPRAGRVGIHDVCFLASPDDYGTFAVSTDQQWLADQTRTVAMGGETCAVNLPRSASPQSDLAAYHWSFLNRDFNTDVLNSWGPDVLADTQRRLGYRLRLTTVTMPNTVHTGATMTVQVEMVNDGYAAPLRARPVQLVLRGTQKTITVALPVNVLAMQPGQTVSVTAQVPAPPTADSYDVMLALPDSSPALATNANYSIQLANPGVWDQANGWNNLSRSLTVTG
jgi:hypothetical protein